MESLCCKRWQRGLILPIVKNVVGGWGACSGKENEINICRVEIVFTNLGKYNSGYTFYNTWRS